MELGMAEAGAGSARNKKRCGRTDGSSDAPGVRHWEVQAVGLVSRLASKDFGDAPCGQDADLVTYAGRLSRSRLCPHATAIAFFQKALPKFWL